MTQLFKSLYDWAAAQPVFIQVALGIALFLVCLYIFSWMLGVGFLTLLRISDKKKEK